jgi:hypothetical protein
MGDHLSPTKLPIASQFHKHWLPLLRVQTFDHVGIQLTDDAPFDFGRGSENLAPGLPSQTNDGELLDLLVTIESEVRASNGCRDFRLDQLRLCCLLDRVGTELGMLVDERRRKNPPRASALGRQPPTMSSRLIRRSCGSLAWSGKRPPCAGTPRAGCAHQEALHPQSDQKQSPCQQTQPRSHLSKQCRSLVAF